MNSGRIEVSLSRTLLHVAGNALKTNITELGPCILPYSEQIHYGFSVIHGKFSTSARRKEIYVPNFKKASNHFCIHAGGRVVIDTVYEKLKLNKKMEKPRGYDFQFGNTYTVFVLYELSYLEKGK